MRGRWIVVLVAWLFCRTLNAQENTDYVEFKGDTLHCLEMEGKVLNALSGKSKECKIELLCYNKVIDSLVLKNRHRKFRFYLKKNSYYAIRISKPGYLTRLICVDTKVPYYPEALYRFAFTTELMDMESARRINQDVLDFPIAFVYFNVKRGYFHYYKKYTSEMKKELAMFN